jgi:hypothetical protein
MTSHPHSPPARFVRRHDALVTLALLLLSSEQGHAQTAPSIDDLNPSGGASVTIDGATTVSFGGTSGAFVVQNDQTTTVTSPAHAASTADRSITTPDGINANTAANDFAYIPAGVTVTQSGGSTDITEGGATDSYTVVFITQPTTTVTITITAEDDLLVFPDRVIFTPTSWNSAQTIVGEAFDDSAAEKSETARIRHSASGVAYTGAPIADVSPASATTIASPPSICRSAST